MPLPHRNTILRRLVSPHFPHLSVVLTSDLDSKRIYSYLEIKGDTQWWELSSVPTPIRDILPIQFDLWVDLTMEIAEATWQDFLDKPAGAQYRK